MAGHVYLDEKGLKPWEEIEWKEYIVLNSKWNTLLTAICKVFPIIYKKDPIKSKVSFVNPFWSGAQHEEKIQIRQKTGSIFLHFNFNQEFIYELSDSFIIPCWIGLCFVEEIIQLNFNDLQKLGFLTFRLFWIPTKLQQLFIIIHESHVSCWSDYINKENKLRI